MTNAVDNSGKVDAPTLPFGVAVRVVFRTLWIQATLNRRGMQNIGALASLVPVAKWLKYSGTQWSDFVGRHLGIFNSNPFISPIGIGALARIEADAAHGDVSAVNTMVERFQSRLATPLGSVGDSLFWSAVRPQMALLGVLITLMWDYWGPVVFIIGFSVWQFTVRWRGLHWGWQLGPKVAVALSDSRLRKPARVAGGVAAITAGITAVVVAVILFAGENAGSDEIPAAMVFVVAAVGSAIVAGTQRPGLYALALGTACSIVASVWVLLAR
jgi:mannose/fructose/N-acetylgalactosamine-specific phosphotransferase system component IID